MTERSFHRPLPVLFFVLQRHRYKSHPVHASLFGDMRCEDWHPVAFLRTALTVSLALSPRRDIYRRTRVCILVLLYLLFRDGKLPDEMIGQHVRTVQALCHWRKVEQSQQSVSWRYLRGSSWIGIFATFRKWGTFGRQSDKRDQHVSRRRLNEIRGSRK